MNKIKYNSQRFLLGLLMTVFLIFYSTLTAYGQSKIARDTLGKKYAKSALKEALSGSTQHNVINNTQILLDTEDKAIKFAEQILFDIYGKKEIQNEKPYEVYNIENYWVISGTLPKGWKGGTFLIIIDSHDYRIVRITHGK